jgi:hypothetical protein
MTDRAFAVLLAALAASGLMAASAQEHSPGDEEGTEHRIPEEEVDDSL